MSLLPQIQRNAYSPHNTPTAPATRISHSVCEGKKLACPENVHPHYNRRRGKDYLCVHLLIEMYVVHMLSHLHGAPSHGDHLEQGDGLHASPPAPRPAWAASPRLSLPSLGVLRAHPGPLLPSLWAGSHREHGYQRECLTLPQLKRFWV